VVVLSINILDLMNHIFSQRYHTELLRYGICEYYA